MHDDRRDVGDRDAPRHEEIDAMTIDDGSDDLLIRRIARELQAPVRLGGDLDARVMAAVHAAAADDAMERRTLAPPVVARADADASTIRRAWHWAARPREIRVSPLAGLAVAAGIAAVLLVAPRGERTAGIATVATVATVERAGTSATARDTGAATYRTVAAAPTSSAPQLVAFVLVAPDARGVSLVGDFNDWNAERTPLRAVRNGKTWTVTVPLRPGQYNYNFVVDGSRWVPDPAAPAAPADEFGTPASVVTVAGVQS